MKPIVVVLLAVVVGFLFSRVLGALLGLAVGLFIITPDGRIRPWLARR